jgi:hypothetical protein
MRWAGRNNYKNAPFSYEDDYGYIPEPAPYEAGNEAFRFPGFDWLNHFVNAYEKVYPNLRIHDDRYPTPGYVRSVAKVGNILYKSDMSGPTDGSVLIKNEILEHVRKDDGDDIIFFTAWGGVNSFSMGLKLIEEEYKNTPGWMVRKVQQQ